MSGTIWSKFYWSDWQSDPALRLCTYAARGLWMDMLCIAAAHDPIGYVAVAGRPLGATDIARMTGGSEDEAAALLGELARNGVFSRDRHGRIFSRRMTEDAKKAAIARKNGRSGGNPSLTKTKGNSTSDNPPDKPPLKTQEPTTSNPEKKKDANASCGRFAEAWKLCTPMMRKRSLSQEKTEPHWRLSATKTEGEDVLIACLRRYLREDPDVGRTGGPGFHLWLRDETWAHYLTAEPASIAPQPVTPEIEAKRLRHLRDTGEWREAWGPKPQPDRLAS